MFRDLIYFDSEKAASLVSQAEGGLVTAEESRTDASDTNRSKLGLDLRLLTGGKDSEESSGLSLIESRILHHGLLTRLESLIEGQASCFTLTAETLNDWVPNSSAFRDSLRQYEFIRVSGRASFYDYRALRVMLESYNELAEFVGKVNVEASDELLQQLSNVDEAIAQTKNRDQKARAKSQATSVRKEMESQYKFPKWKLDGLSKFLDTFVADKLEAWIHPNAALDFHIVSNLKDRCFVDATGEEAIRSYGQSPDVQLEVLGFISSMPGPSGGMSKTEDAGQGDLLEGFGQMFEARKTLEDVWRVPRYPNVGVYPVAIYQPLGSDEPV